MIRADLAPLRAELALWQIEGRRARLWLRDDDAVAATTRIAAMAEVFRRFSLRSLLAVIPALMEKKFAAAVAEFSCLIPCQHGWRHTNHEPLNAPKAEFGSARPETDAIADIERGRQFMSQAFGERFAPIFVPPWNRIAPGLVAHLPALGFTGLSAYRSDEKSPVVSGLVVADAAIDVMTWDRPIGQGAIIVPLELLAQRLAELLREQRSVQKGSQAEPIGLLTHHRAMDDAAWDVVTAIISATLDAGVVDWIDPAELFELQTVGKVPAPEARAGVRPVTNDLQAASAIAARCPNFTAGT